MSLEEILKESPFVQVFKIDPKEAVEVAEFVSKKLEEGTTREELLRIAKERYTGKKLLFAISYIEFGAGFNVALQHIIQNIIFPPFIGDGES